MIQKNVLLIGCGNIAGGFDLCADPKADPYTHAAAFAKNKNFKLQTCIDPDKVKLNKFKDKWNFEEAYTTIDAISECRGKYAVISICTPTSFHHEHLIFALSLKPKLIFCEKPIATSYLDAKFHVRQCEAANVLMAVNYTRRWSPDILQLKNDLSNGQWGEIRSVNGIYSKGLLNNGSHMLDILTYLLGPLKLISCGLPVIDYSTEDPSVPIFLQSENNVPVFMNIGCAADYSIFEFEIYTEHGVLAIEGGGAKWRIRKPIDSKVFNGYKILDIEENRIGCYRKSMASAISNINQVIDGEAELLSTGQSALLSHVIVDDVMRRISAQ